MHTTHRIVRAALLVSFAASALAMTACSAPVEQPVGKSSSPLTIVPLGAHERAVLSKHAGRTLRLDEGGMRDVGGTVYAGASDGHGTWAFAQLDPNRSDARFQMVTTEPALGIGAATKSSVHVLDFDPGAGGGGSCDYSACRSATASARDAKVEWLSNVGSDDLVALVYGLRWYQLEVEKENACGGCR